MAFWFEKNNFRRFRRMDMAVKLFVTPADPIKDKELFALGIDYFPNTVQKKIARNQKQLLSWVNHIQEQKEILEPVFLQVVDAAQLLGEVVKSISKGHNPLLDEQMTQQIMLNLKSVGRIASLEEPAPKTFQYFYEIEKKLTHFFRLLLLSLHKSSSNQYHSFDISQPDFKIDGMTQRFTQPSFQKIPLVQAIYFMSELVSTYCDIFQEMNSDYYLREHPEAWKERDVTISAGGFSTMFPKRFLPGRPLTSYIYFAEQARTIKVKTQFARAESNSTEMLELNAFYFEFPDQQDQKFLELEIERLQIDKTANHCINHQFLLSLEGA
ncbi:hypothetical protein [Thiomicrorhabdus sp. Milos-T2]|uniref:hypothetical protein n=1 Tax=Thiomicrorhabdus sp. Milos-T2 TaxID=90814 RepID=UPI000494A366|nr:hypothetical protein [Thiomicrorhabdus sp. Milos-T2]